MYAFFDSSNYVVWSRKLVLKKLCENMENNSTLEQGPVSLNYNSTSLQVTVTILFLKSAK